MSTLKDAEFGDITIRRSARASSIRLRVAPDGTLRVSAPLYAPLFLIRRLVNSSRAELRKLTHEHQKIRHYRDGMQIGKSHSLTIREADIRTPRATREGLRIIIHLPHTLSPDDPAALRAIREAVAKALRIEAKSYLPKRLQFLAEKHGFFYQTVRFSHASGRWGSCSSKGTISLNIALMLLPFELIDYVLAHELSHTREMNHSKEFWQVVAQVDPDYKSHRRALKDETPSI